MAPWFNVLARIVASFGLWLALTPSAVLSDSGEPATNAPAATNWVWFPSQPSTLAAYLGGIDAYGTNALQPDSTFPKDPLSRWVQEFKLELSQIGLQETLYQSVSLVQLGDPVAGQSTLEYYAATFQGKWAVATTPSGTATWLSFEMDAQTGLSSTSRTQTPQANLGSLVNPQANVSGFRGVWMSELAGQIASSDGNFVLVAGLLDQANYLDVNAYANNSQSQFVNNALLNNSALPLPPNNLGLNLQWQPSSLIYLLLGTSANNQTPGQAPTSDLSFDNWSYLGELGFTPTNVFGLGPGTYRLQPFLATVQSHTQAGLGVNLQQQLGPTSPWGVFGRFGVSGTQVAIQNVGWQGSTGIALTDPLQSSGLISSTSSDVLGLGWVWSQAARSSPQLYHANEYALELFYSWQLTPTIKVQPDVQLYWNAAYRPDSGVTTVWQLQVNMIW